MTNPHKSQGGPDGRKDQPADWIARQHQAKSRDGSHDETNNGHNQRKNRCLSLFHRSTSFTGSQVGAVAKENYTRILDSVALILNLERVEYAKVTPSKFHLFTLPLYLPYQAFL